MRKKLKIDVDEIINNLNSSSLKSYNVEEIKSILKRVNEIGLINTCNELNISRSTVRYWIYNDEHKKQSKDNYSKNKKTKREKARNRYNENRELYLERAKKYREKNPEKMKEWRKNNPQKMEKYKKTSAPKWRKQNKEKIKQINTKWEITQRNDNPSYKVLRSLRSRTHSVIKNQSTTKEETTLELTACSPSQLKSHLESLFQEGMSWDNYGVHGWHIDHIIPCASFDFTNSEEQRKCFHYTNLQPLWAVDNLSKGSKID